MSAMARDEASVEELVWRLLHSDDFAGLEVELEKYGVEVDMLQSTVCAQREFCFATHLVFMSLQQQGAVVMGFLSRISSFALLLSTTSTSYPIDVCVAIGNISDSKHYWV